MSFLIKTTFFYLKCESFETHRDKRVCQNLIRKYSRAWYERRALTACVSALPPYISSQNRYQLIQVTAKIRKNDIRHGDTREKNHINEKLLIRRTRIPLLHRIEKNRDIYIYIGGVTYWILCGLGLEDIFTSRGRSPLKIRRVRISLSSATPTQCHVKE